TRWSMPRWKAPGCAGRWRRATEWRGRRVGGRPSWRRPAPDASLLQPLIERHGGLGRTKILHDGAPLMIGRLPARRGPMASRAAVFVTLAIVAWAAAAAAADPAAIDRIVQAAIHDEGTHTRSPLCGETLTAGAADTQPRMASPPPDG